MLNLSELNALNQKEFTGLIGPVFEHSSWIAEETWGQRPFADRQELHAALCRTVTAATDEAQLELIRAHPDLAGRMRLTDASQKEQTSARLDRLSEDELARFDERNREYRTKFGFPFVICARLNNKDAILDAFETRLKNSTDEEKQTALQEIFKIADLRLREIVE